MKILFTFLLFITELSFAQKMALECKDPVQTTNSCSLKNEAPQSAIQSHADAIEKDCEKQTMSVEFAKAAVDTGAIMIDISTEEAIKGTIGHIKKSIKASNENLEMFKPFIEDFEGAKKKMEAKKAEQAIETPKVTQAYEKEKDPEKKQKIFDEYHKKYPSVFTFIPSSKAEAIDAMEVIKKQIAHYESQLAQFESQLAAKVKGASSADDKMVEKVAIALENENQNPKSNSKFKDCGLTNEEIAGIRWYSGNMYRILNEVLRSNDPDRIKRYQPIINAINSGLEKLKPFTEVVTRLANLPPEVVTKHCMGCVVVYDAFTSTSSSNVFNGPTMFVIKSKKGRYIAPLSQHTNEEEVLFKSGTKFQVLNIEKKDGTTYYTMEEVE